ncbi:maleylpyruvate isomerase N-terminal domain-containing protein [Actinomycetospora flava]|uniref:Maleylpyruvate isomerase N-terminal domain-containing protein n=1 Tax=Actinomycetospora flava TaxID=3129232 RepID=A0ABU8M9J5_9PSEU
MTADTAVLAAARDERAALAGDLAGLTDHQWATPSLCDRWTVEETVAHLTAAASIGPWRWLRSVLGARFDFDLHNDRRLAEHRGATRPRPSPASGRSSPARRPRGGRSGRGSARSSCTARTCAARWAWCTPRPSR